MTLQSSAQVPPPFFVVRNSKHSSSNGASCDDVDDDRCGESACSDEGATKDVPESRESVAIVRLVEAPEPRYRLDFASAEESFFSNFLEENAVQHNEQTVEGEKTYLDGRAWRDLYQYSELVGTPLTKGNEEELGHNDRLSAAMFRRPLFLLEDTLRDVIHTLLPMDSLFSWQVLVDARNDGKLQWKGIRALLSLVRANVPFITNDGILRRVVNAHLTFHQFVAFSQLVQQHLSNCVEPDNVVPDVDVSDIFPSFDALTPEEQVVELLASVKDKAVRTEAQLFGLAIPTSADGLPSVSECSQEWKVYMQWWSAYKGRSAFCMRELQFAEKNQNVRRRAVKEGISMRGRHSQDPVLREQFLRRFGSWYLGNDDGVGEDEPAAHTVASEEKLLCKTTLYTYDFMTSQNDTIESNGLAHLAPPNLAGFQNKAWQPESTTRRGEIPADDQESSPPLARSLVISSAGGSAVDNELSPSSPHCYRSTPKDTYVASDAPDGADSLGNHPNAGDAIKPVDTTVESDVQQDDCRSPEKRASIGGVAATLLIGSKIHIMGRNKPSFRRAFLRRLTADIDNVASMLAKKEGSKLRGIELFRSKVRLVMLLQKFSLGKSFQALDSQNVDIFKLDLAKLPATKPKRQDGPKENPDGSISKELLDKAKAHHERALCSKIFQAMVKWAHRSILEKQKKRELEQQWREMLERADDAHARSVQSKFFLALKNYTEQQKAERANAAAQVPPDEASVEQEEEEEFSFGLRPPGVESRCMDVEDTRSHKFRDKYRKLVLDTTLFDELNCMQLVVGRNRPSGLDVLDHDEYNQHYANGIELTTNRTAMPTVPSSLTLLDETTLAKMRREKLAGQSNLFDVPPEFIDMPQSDDGFHVEYRAREKVRGIIAESS